MYQSKQRGIGLLELMLSLAIIAVLLIMATRYYQAAHQNQLISQGVDMFGAVQGAVQTYRLDYPLTAELNINTLVSKGYLPNSFGSGTSSNPWGGLIQMKISSATGVLNVGMTGVPTGACELLGKRLKDTISSIGGQGTTYSAACSSSFCGSAVTGTTNAVCAAYPL